jgi:hypothetical protein
MRLLEQSTLSLEEGHGTVTIIFDRTDLDFPVGEYVRTVPKAV